MAKNILTNAKSPNLKEPVSQALSSPYSPFILPQRSG